ncbi:MAG: hypothetical protein PHQ61_08665 [Candidatus Omnitrophica bacterium]|nr:hypothetical protein [Candidatus Omnitrophota bacterium]
MRNKFIWVMVLFVLAGAAVSGAGSISHASPEAMDGVTSSTMFRYDLPANWKITNGTEAEKFRKEIEATTKQMAQSYASDSGAYQAEVGIKAFKAIRLPEGSGWLLDYEVSISPQKDYLNRMVREQKEKIAWGKKQGIVTNVLEQGIVEINGTEVVKVELEMRQGYYNVLLYYWTQDRPDRVGTMNLLVNPGAYKRLKDDIDRLMNTLEIG